MLRGELHNRGSAGRCEACGEIFPCPSGLAIYEAVKREIKHPMASVHLHRDDVPDTLELGGDGPDEPRLQDLHEPAVIDTRDVDPKVRDVFDLAERIQSTLLRHWRTRHLEIPEDGVTSTERVVLVAVAKAYKTYRSILILCREGYVNDAEVLLRTLFELAVSGRYVKLDQTGRRAQRWLDSYIVTRYQTLRVAQKGDSLLAEVRDFLDLHPELVRELEEQALAMQERKRYWSPDPNGGLGRPKHWSGRSVAAMARAAGWESAYDTLYRSASLGTHSDIHSLVELLEEGEGGGYRVNALPSAEGVTGILATAAKYFFEIVWDWGEILGQDELLAELERIRAEEQPSTPAGEGG